MVAGEAALAVATADQTGRANAKDAALWCACVRRDMAARTPIWRKRGFLERRVEWWI